ncbi:MAG: hypothetical protein IJK03_00115 [Oscillospiraceae bacterium]|nr:hypothetical protein [Oscillospiraceae bacterium]
MGTGVTELKREVMLREWSARIAECRGSGKAVKEWSAEQGISVQTYYRCEKRFVEKATQQLSLPAPTQAGMLMRVNPETLPSDEMGTVGPCITIRHGKSVIILPAGSSAEAVADLVRALNCHA